MTRSSRHITRFVFVAVAAASLSVAACGGGVCNCPAGVGFKTVALPAAQSSPIAGASADPPCFTTFDSTSVQVGDSSAGTCQVTVQLANGDSYGFSVQFLVTRLGGDCACNGAVAVDASAPEQLDAGAGD